MVIGQPEPLQLFQPSEHGAGIDTPQEDVEERALARVRHASAAVRAAECRLERAIRNGRAVGCSWRHLAGAASVPFQTMHRRYRDSDQKLDSIRRSVDLAELRDAPTDRDSKGPARFAQEFGLGADDDGGVEKKRGR